MPIYDLIEWSDNYSKISGSLWQHSRDEQASDNNGDIINFADNNTTDSFTFKEKITKNKKCWNKGTIEIFK